MGTCRHTPPTHPPQGEQAALFPTLPFSSTTAQPGTGGPGTGLAAPGVPAGERATLAWVLGQLAPPSLFPGAPHVALLVGNSSLYVACGGVARV